MVNYIVAGFPCTSLRSWYKHN